MKSDKSAGDFRDAILFEDILKNQKRIILYNTNGIEYRRVRLYLIAMLGWALGSYFLIRWSKNNAHVKVALDYETPGQVMQVVMVIGTALMILKVSKMYRRVQKMAVEKITYDTQKDKF